MFAKLRSLRKALALYEALTKGDTALLVEYFPFVKAAFTPKLPPIAPLVPRKPLDPPKIVYRPRTDEEDLRDALDIGFSNLKFDPVQKDDAKQKTR